MSCLHPGQGIEGSLVFALRPGNSLDVKTKFFSHLIRRLHFRTPPPILIFMDTPERFQMYPIAGKE